MKRSSIFHSRVSKKDPTLAKIEAEIKHKVDLKEEEAA